MTGEQTYVLFGGWQTEREQGFVAVTQTPRGTDTQISREPRGDRPIETELTERVEQGIEQAHTNKQAPTQQTSTPQTTREPGREQDHEREQPAELDPGERSIDQANDITRDPGAEQTDMGPEHVARDTASEQVEPPEDAARDPYIEQAIQEAQDRQQTWEQGIDQDRDSDRGFGIE
jgi:hypothetical protein